MCDKGTGTMRAWFANDKTGKRKVMGISVHEAYIMEGSAEKVHLHAHEFSSDSGRTRRWGRWEPPANFYGLGIIFTIIFFHVVFIRTLVRVLHTARIVVEFVDILITDAAGL